MRSFVLKACLFLGIAWALSLKAGTAEDISNLLSNSPFVAPTAGNASAPTQTPLELRGIVVEGGVARFIFFDGAANKWLTLRQGEEADALVVRSYDRVQDLVVLDYKGRTLSLSLKSAGNQSYAGATPISAYAATSVSTKVPSPQPVLIPSLSEAETRRLEIVAAALRQRREQNKHGTQSSVANGS